MAGKPIATIGSMHLCPMCTGTVPHVGGPVSGPGAPNVLVNNKPVALMGDMCVCVGPPDVIAQGHPLVKVNGVPVVCVGDLTAHGGAVTVGEPTVMISTAVPTPSVTMPKEKIPFPTITFVNRAIAVLSGNSLTEAEKNIAALAAQAEETPVSDDSDEVTFTTTFPQDQLHLLASNSNLPSFLSEFFVIFGYDIPSRAYEELYNDAKENAATLEPTWVVKKSVPYTGKALFYNKEDVQEIWIDENFIIEATEDNEVSGELLAAIVEEYGHWLDYLLRNTYAETERKDALRDEGAYFSYQLMELNAIHQKDQHFADATTPSGSHQLIWDYEPQHKNIKDYVDEERWYKDDHFGPFEFYKAGFLDSTKGEYSHGNIERLGLTKSFIDSEINDQLEIGQKPKEIEDYLLNIYFGNWMRDFSQGLDPLITRVLSNSLKAFSQETTQEISEYTSIYGAAYNVNKLRSDTVKEGEEITYGFDILGYNLFEHTFRPVDGSVKIICTLLEMIAAKEFIYLPLKESGHTGNLNYKQYLKELKEKFAPIQRDTMGVYVPAEHIDNPNGLGGPIEIYVKNENYNPETDPSKEKYVLSEKANDDTDILKEFIGADTFTNTSLHHINTDFGMKNYIRNSNTGLGIPATEGNRYLYSHTYILDKLDLACVANGWDKKIHKEAHHNLGAALHTLEDFFAHTNYAELALIKEGFTNVFPWVTKVTAHVKKPNGTYNEVPKLDYTRYVTDNDYKSEVFNNPEKYTIVSNTKGVKSTNNLVSKLPLVTGTFGALDTVASILPIIAGFFRYDKKVADREEALKKEKRAKEEAKRVAGTNNNTHEAHKHDSHEGEDETFFYNPNNINTRAFPEVLAIELLRDITNEDEVKGADTEDSIIVNTFLTALAGRDYIEDTAENINKLKKKFWEKLPENWRDKAAEINEDFTNFKNRQIDKTLVPIYKSMYTFLVSTYSSINDIQVLLSSDVEYLTQQADNNTWDVNIGMNPTHTQVAKDDPDHPMHTLSAKLAIEAVTQVGTKVFNLWQGKPGATFKTVEDAVNAIMKDPAQTTWQNKTVREWTSDAANKGLICTASSPSVAIGRLLHINEHIRGPLEELKNISKTPVFRDTEKALEKVYNDQKKLEGSAERFELFEDKLAETRRIIEATDTKIKELRTRWENQFPKPFYCDASFDDMIILEYEVKPNDVLSTIAKDHHTTVEDILELNPELDPSGDTVYAGQYIKIPSEKGLISLPPTTPSD